MAFIEVKRVLTKLAAKQLRQVDIYAVDEGVEWAVLTNGSEWGAPAFGATRIACVRRPGSGRLPAGGL